MRMIDVKCPNTLCPKQGQTLRMDEKFRGKKVKCIYCKCEFRVPDEPQSAIFLFNYSCPRAELAAPGVLIRPGTARLSSSSNREQTIGVRNAPNE